MRPTPRHGLALLAATALLAACGQAQPEASGSTDRVTIVADVYPTAFAASAIGGDAVEVVLLTQPGVEPHDLELTPEQVRQIADADLVAHVPGLIPAVAEAAAAEAPDRTVDVTAGIVRATSSDGSPSGDPHVWLDPRSMTAMGDAIARALSEHDLGSGWDTAGLAGQMEALDADYHEALGQCRIRPLVVTHEAFGYLADAYGFEQHALSGMSPEAEPSPARLADIARLVREQGVTTVYHEALVSPEAAEALARETGARTAVLDPIEGSTDGRSYPDLMRANLEALVAGQDCA